MWFVRFGVDVDVDVMCVFYFEESFVRCSWGWASLL